jgi:hypothetical protein
MGVFYKRADRTAVAPLTTTVKAVDQSNTGTASGINDAAPELRPCWQWLYSALFSVPFSA